MKTWQAALANIAALAIQAGMAQQFFSPSGWGPLQNIGVQTGLQAALVALQIWTAKLNSGTDPNGQKLEPLPGGAYTSAPFVTK